MLIARRVAFIVTLKCTLNCKLCCNCVTKYDNPPMIAKESLLRDVDAVFEIYDRVEWLQFVGGELFMHPDMGDILTGALRHSDRFDKIILMTNGTIVPKESVISAMKQLGERIEVQISDYGKLSYKLEELANTLATHKIPHVVKSYHGDIQHYGGWIDCGEFEDRNYDELALETVFRNCSQIQMKNLHVYNGKLHNCIRSLFGQDLGEVDVPNDEFIDLQDESLSLEAKKAIAMNFCTKPLHTCRYCGGFDTNSAIRYPAAEQI